MDKRIFIVVAFVVVAAGAYYWWAYPRAAPEAQKLEEAATLLSGDAAGATEKAITSIDPSVKPVGETPDVNPLTRTNPFSGVKTNPFE